MFIEQLQRKKGKVYRAHVRKHGKHLTKTFTRKYNAQQWAQETELLLDGGCSFELTFQQLAEDWIENHSKVKNSPSYYHEHKTQLLRVLPVLGVKNVRDITFKDIERLVGELKAQNPERSANTINRFLAFVRAIFNYGMKRNDLLRNPVRKEHFLPEPEQAFQYWQFEEANRFIEYAEQKYRSKDRHIYLTYMIALNTGMRFGEIAGLKWDAVFLQGPNPSITIRRSVCSATKQVRETTKGRRVRYVGVNAALHKALLEAYHSRSNGFVVSNRGGGPLDGPNLLNRNFKQDCAEAGVTLINFHSMRHTYASLYVMQNGSLYDLQKILGHSDIKTTERYAHFAKDYLLNKASIVEVGRRENVIEVDFKKA